MASPGPARSGIHPEEAYVPIDTKLRYQLETEDFRLNIHFKAQAATVPARPDAAALTQRIEDVVRRLRTVIEETNARNHDFPNRPVKVVEKVVYQDRGPLYSRVEQNSPRAMFRMWLFGVLFGVFLMSLRNFW